MTADLSYTTTEREGESSARTINGMENKTDTKSRTALKLIFRKATPTVISYSSTVGVFRFKITL